MSLEVYAMTKSELMQKVKTKLFYDAEKRTGTVTEARRIIQYLMKDKSISENEMISWSKEYAGKAKYNKDSGLDYELRKIARLGSSYFNPNRIVNRAKQEIKESRGILDRIFGNTGLPRWAQGIVFGVGILSILGIGGAVIRKKWSS